MQGTLTRIGLIIVNSFSHWKKWDSTYLELRIDFLDTWLTMGIPACGICSCEGGQIKYEKYDVELHVDVFNELVEFGFVSWNDGELMLVE